MNIAVSFFMFVCVSVGWWVTGRCPPMSGHGGVSAMLIDQLLGHAAAVPGHPGVTTELSVRYRRPVPLDVPLRVGGRVIEAEGRRVAVIGESATQPNPASPWSRRKGGAPGSAPTRPGACSAIWRTPTPPTPT